MIFLFFTAAVPADDAWRKDLGQKTLSETDLDWISEIVPEVSEVLYDGRHLVINLFYKTDPLPFARGYLPGVEGSPICDILCAEYALTVDGEAIPQSSYSHGLDFSKWFERMDDPRFSIDDVRADGGVYGQVTIDFPSSPALPNGTCKAELHMSVLAQTDPSGPESRVATIVQQFSFDTVKANAGVRDEILKTQRFSGEAVATVHHYGDVLENPDENAAYKTWDARGNRIDTSGGQWVENQLVDLSNLAVTPIVHRKSTGLSIELQYKLPENWSYDLQNAVVGFLSYELVVDGVSQGIVFSEGAFLSPIIEVSLTESELLHVKTIVLKPSLTHFIACGDGDPLPIGKRIMGPPSALGGDQVPLMGCDISIPLK